MKALYSFLESISEVPYVLYGRDRSGLDCWGLITLAYKELKGIELPEYTEQYSNKRLSRVSSIMTGEKQDDLKYKKIDKPSILCIVLIKYKSIPVHCGIYVGNNKIAHIDKGHMVCIESLNNFNVEGFYIPC